MVVSQTHILIESAPRVPFAEVREVLAGCSAREMHETDSRLEATVETEDVAELSRALAASLERVLLTQPSSLVLEQRGGTTFYVRPAAA
jgi:hypothetical protein